MFVCINSAKSFSIKWVYHGLFIHPLLEEHLHYFCFQFLAIMNKAGMTTHIQILCEHRFNLFSLTGGSIARSCGKFV